MLVLSFSSTNWKTEKKSGIHQNKRKTNPSILCKPSYQITYIFSKHSCLCGRFFSAVFGTLIAVAAPQYRVLQPKKYCDSIQRNKGNRLQCSISLSSESFARRSTRTIILESRARGLYVVIL